MHTVLPRQDGGDRRRGRHLPPVAARTNRLDCGCLGPEVTRFTS